MKLFNCGCKSQRLLFSWMFWVSMMCGLVFQAHAVEPFIQSISLKEAIDMAMQHNLQLGLSQERVEIARAALDESRSALGPRVSLSASQSNLSTNLRAQGFPNNTALFPSSVLGPFNSFDARLSLTQTLFNPVQSHRTLSSQGQLVFAQHQELAFRDQILAATALAYVNAQQKSARLDAALANLHLSKELAVLAHDQHKAGIATGVDVARSETRVSQDQYFVTQAQSQRDESLIRLKRVMGLSSRAPIVLSTPLEFNRFPIPNLENAVAEATSQREELKALEAQVQAAQESLNAADSEVLPEIGIHAGIGPSGVNAGQGVYTTRSIGIGMTIPLITSGELSAHHSRAYSQFKTAKLQQEDAQRQVEEDVALALLSLQTYEEQVSVAKKSLELAERLLELSRDRFKAGVTDNLEVVDALTAYESARARLIDATAEYAIARVNTAAALGTISRFEL